MTAKVPSKVIGITRICGDQILWEGHEPWELSLRLGEPPSAHPRPRFTWRPQQEVSVSLADCERLRHELLALFESYGEPA
jgi:hypothetical protein